MNDNDMKKSWYTFLPKWYESEMCVYSVFIRDTALSILLPHPFI